MKYVIVIPDGCADEPQDSLDGKTPLEAAHTPAMDSIVSQGIVGSANHTPAHLPAGSEVANISLLGYDPDVNFTGRAPLEAAAQGIQLGPDDWAVRCNLVTITDQIMTSFTAGHISTAESEALLRVAQQNLASDNLQFVAGVSYRNLLLYRATENVQAPFSNETRTTPPHDLSDKSIANDFPRGPGSQLLSNLMNLSGECFCGHSVNSARVQAGQMPATHVWLWGLGRQPAFETFESKFGIRGAMITAVDLLRGLAALIGWDRIEVPGATGYVDTDYAAKGRHAIAALTDHDIVCVHIEAPDEASHEGDVTKKIAAIEAIDGLIVQPIMKYFADLTDWRILVTPDHPTYVRTKTHTHGDVPFAICGAGIRPDSFHAYHERNAQQSNVCYPHGFQLMPAFLAATGINTA